jgi:hypothetical protein
MNKSSEENVSNVSTDDEDGEGEKRELEPSNADATELSIVQSGNGHTSTQGKESQTQPEASPLMQSNTESSANAIDTTVNSTVAEVTTGSSEPGIVASTPLFAETTDVAEKRQSTPLALTEELRDTDKETVSDSSLAPVPQEERPSEAPKLSVDRQECELCNDIDIPSLQARLKEVEQCLSGTTPFHNSYTPRQANYCVRRVYLFQTIAGREAGC